MYFTENDLKEAALFSKQVISRAKVWDKNVFTYAKMGKKYFELISDYLAAVYVREISLVEYKYNELELYGSVYGKQMSNKEIFEEIIRVIENQYGNLFKEMIDVLRNR